MKIGAITIGQAPRTDVTADILHIFDDSLELVQAGGLDGLTKEQIAEFAPGKDDYVLVSRLTDGSSVTFAERHILPRLQDAINRMEDEGCSLIMMFCTGSFPETLSTRKIPMIYPCELLNRLVPLMTKKSDIICMTTNGKNMWIMSKQFPLHHMVNGMLLKKQQKKLRILKQI